MQIYSILFSIYLSIDGYLGCFYILAIVNKTAMDMGFLDFGFKILIFGFRFQDCNGHGFPRFWFQDFDF